MPFKIIITAANTVSRARAVVAGPPDSMSETISATSMIVTAIANTSVPYGSPSRCAMTSAWCTAASTLASMPMVKSRVKTVPAPPAHMLPINAQPASGTAHDQKGK